MNDEILKRKEDFKNWLSNILKEDNNPYNETQINAYCYSLEQASSKLKVSSPLVQSNVFCYDNIKSFNRAYALIVGASNYSKVDMATGNRTFSGALMHYSNFLKATVKNGKQSQNKASFVKYFDPIITTLRDLGGTATLLEVKETIAKKYNISDAELSLTNGGNPDKHGTNKFIADISFAINYLVMTDLIDNNFYDSLTLTPSGVSIEIDDKVAYNIFTFGMNKNRAKTKKFTPKKKYWLYPIDKIRSIDNWSEFKESQILSIPFGELGDLRGYCNKTQMSDILKECFGDISDYQKTARLTWQFVNEMQLGDIVFIQDRNKILARGIVTSEYGYDDAREDSYNHTREVKWTNIGEWILAEPKLVNTLTEVTQYIGYLEGINKLFNNDITEVEELNVRVNSYNEENFLTEVYMSDREYHRLTSLLKTKKNIILQGPAGVGKTFIAKRLAYALLGEKNQTRVKFIQFHQSYSYEEFFMGYRPTNIGLEIQYGVFYNFCKQAELDDENDYYFIIDEINRGNLSRIFGELFMLIESDKRGEEMQLTYTKELFSVPENVYIIGMMNTADRGLAMLDYALRRRFGFYEITPKFDSVGFRDYQSNLNNNKFNKLILEIKNLNREIEFDENLGKGFAIGHSYFIKSTNQLIQTDELQSIIDFEILALLNEYWFDEPSKVYEWKKRLNEAIQ